MSNTVRTDAINQMCGPIEQDITQYNLMLVHARKLEVELIEAREDCGQMAQRLGSVESDRDKLRAALREVLGLFTECGDYRWDAHMNSMIIQGWRDLLPNTNMTGGEPARRKP